MRILSITIALILALTGLSLAEDVIVVYKADETVSVFSPNYNNYQTGESMSSFLDWVYRDSTTGTSLQGRPYDIIDSSMLPAQPKRDKWRGNKQNGLRVDNLFQTRAEKRQALSDSIDNELDENSPDFKKVIKLQRKLEKGDY